MSLHARSHTYGACVFTCNLPPALSAEWLGSFTCYCCNTGWNGYQYYESAQKVDPGEENAPTGMWTCVLSITSLALWPLSCPCCLFPQIWDVNHSKLIRTMGGHAGRVGCLDWNAHVLSRWVTLETFISTAALFRLLLLHMIINHSLLTSSSLSSANVNLQLYFSTKLCSSGAVPPPTPPPPLPDWLALTTTTIPPSPHPPPPLPHF